MNKFERFRQPFEQGYDNPEVTDPYLSSSENSDAFLLGQLAAQEKLPRDSRIHKTKGHWWIMADFYYTINGKKITKGRSTLPGVAS